MSEVRPPSDDGMDLIEFFGTLQEGKWKIIATTFAAAAIGVVFSVVKPNSFEGSIPIRNGKPSAFTQYVSLNEVSKSNKVYLSIDGNSIFNNFITEFGDYEEMVDSVSTSEFVQQSIKNLEDEDKQRALIGFAKAFKLEAPKKSEENWTISFSWHDDLEGARLLNDAISQTLSNVKNRSIIDVGILSDALDFRNALKLERLYNKLDVMAETVKMENKKRIQYLTEQSAIARELGVDTNSLDTNVLSQPAQNEYRLNLSLSYVPYYLRGYNAIDKEISLIQKRSDEDNLLAGNDYIETKEQILALETDLSSSHMIRASEVLANDNPNDWLSFDLSYVDMKSQKKPMLYVALSIILGGVIGAMYVLISSAIRKRKYSSAKG